MYGCVYTLPSCHDFLLLLNFQWKAIGYRAAVVVRVDGVINLKI